MAVDPKKASQTKAYKNSKNVISWWNKQHPKSKFLFLIIICLGLIVAAGLPGWLGPDKNTQIKQMSAALPSAQPMVNDLYTSLKAYDSGATDSKTVINKLQADKEIVDSSISKIEGANPPDELKRSHTLVLSALKDLSTSLGLGIDGVKTDNFSKIYQAIRSKDDLTAKFNEAAGEVSKLPVSTS
jgi:hypothetical protein